VNGIIYKSQWINSYDALDMRYSIMSGALVGGEASSIKSVSDALRGPRTHQRNILIAL
jgi:hypothetical protein